MTAQTEVLYTVYQDNFAEVEPEVAVARQRVNFMVALAESAAEWTRLKGAAVADTTADGRTTAKSCGLQFADFKVFVCQHNPELEQQEIYSIAVELENDISRFVSGSDQTETATFLDTVNDSASFDPTDVMAYSVHKIKETGLPFEGTRAESRVADALDEHFLQLGINVSASPFAQIKQDTLLTT